MDSMREMARRIADIQEKIDAACARVGRDPAGVTLIAVSKSQPAELVREAYACGLRHFGESRWPEVEQKVQALPEDATWHFIGPLQTNKVKSIASVVDVVHSISSIRQLEKVPAQNRTLDAFVQVNIAKEEQKSGIFPEDLDKTVEDVLRFSTVRFCGLMTIGPIVETAEEIRPVFRELSRLAQRIGARGLSMGMSGDFETAVEEGATHVRIGSAIFQSR